MSVEGATTTHLSLLEWKHLNEDQHNLRSYQIDGYCWFHHFDETQIIAGMQNKTEADPLFGDQCETLTWIPMPTQLMAYFLQ